MAQSELTISQLNLLFGSGPVYLHNTARCKDICPGVEKVAELKNGRPDGKIVFAIQGGEINQKFTFEPIPGTAKCKIVVKTVDDKPLYVTSAKPVADGDSIVVSTEGTVYAVGYNGSGHTISTKSENGVELFWTLEDGKNGSKIALRPYKAGEDNQGWIFRPVGK